MSSEEPWKGWKCSKCPWTGQDTKRSPKKLFTPSGDETFQACPVCGAACTWIPRSKVPVLLTTPFYTIPVPEENEKIENKKQFMRKNRRKRKEEKKK